MFKRFRKSIRKFLSQSLTNAGIWGWTHPGQWSKTDLINQYQRVMYSVISAIAEDSAKIEFTAVRKGKGKDMPVKTHPFLDLMEHPNPDQSQFQFLELHFTYLKLAGEVYWYMVRNKGTKAPQELYIIRPDLMEVVVSKDNNPRGLVTGYLLYKPDGEKIPFDKEEILHFKMPNPSNPYYGLGTIQAAMTYIQTEQYASDWTKNSLYNSGRPSGIVNIKGTIDDEQFKSIKQQFKDEYGGTTNAGKTLFLKGTDGMDFQKLGMELGELALKELKDMTRDDIMMMFRVSKTMLGISEGVNLNNAREGRAMFKESIVLAEWDRLVDHLNAFILPDFGTDGIKIEYEHPDLQSGTDKVAEWTAGLNKWLTINDVRKERNLQPIPGGDVIYQAINLVPLTKESETPAPTPPNDSNNPNQDPNADPNADTNTDPNKNPKDKKPPKEGKSVKKKELTQKDIFEEQLFNIQEAWVPSYRRAIKQELATQEQEILSHHKKNFAEWLFDTEASKNRLVGKLLPLGVELMKASAKVAFDVANDPDSEFEVDQQVNAYLHDRIIRMAGGMNDETTKQLHASLAEGIKNGEALGDLKKRVAEIYNIASGYRAERIARTESIATSNEGILAAYRQSPLVNAKEWSVSPDACEYCLEFDGTIVGLDENFATQGSSIELSDGRTFNIDYEDVEHPPLHPNCRCTLLPVVL